MSQPTIAPPLPATVALPDGTQVATPETVPDPAVAALDEEKATALADAATDRATILAADTADKALDLATATQRKALDLALAAQKRTMTVDFILGQHTEHLGKLNGYIVDLADEAKAQGVALGRVEVKLDGLVDTIKSATEARRSNRTFRLSAFAALTTLTSVSLLALSLAHAF